MLTRNLKSRKAHILEEYHSLSKKRESYDQSDKGGQCGSLYEIGGLALNFISLLSTMTLSPGRTASWRTQSHQSWPLVLGPY